MGHYFAVMVPAKEGGFFVRFPDIPEAFTQGDDFEDALTMADDVLHITAEEYAKARKDLPPASNFEAVKTWAENNLNELGNPGHIRIQAYKAPNVDMTPVRLTISVPKATLNIIDEKSKKAGFTRSGFLAHAALAYGQQ